MAIIPPNSTVWLCANVPFDIGYNHTKLYSSASAQFADIASKAIGTYDHCTYVRPGKLRVTCAYGQAWKVNYIIYNNTNFESKYFYAFVTEYKYINNEVCEFSFVTDVIQTWMFNYTMKQVFVEREHIATDAIGASLTEEGLETGNFVVSKQLKDKYSREFKICVVTTFKMTETTEGGETAYTYDVAQGKIYGKTYCGLELNFFGSAQGVNQFLKQVNEDGKIDGVVNIFMAPSEMGQSVQERDITIYPFNSSESGGSNDLKEGNLFEGYVPKNKKLYQYPYRFVRVLNGRGNVGTYKWEESNFYTFSVTNPVLKFREYIGGYNNPEILLSCFDNGFGLSDFPNPANVMTNGGCIPCSYSSDAYKAWLAQNQGQLQYLDTHRTLTLARGVVSALAGGRSTNAFWDYAPSSASTALSTVLRSGSDYIPTFNMAQPLESASSVGTAVNTLISWYDEVARKSAILTDHEVMPPQACVVTTAGQLSNDSGLAGFTFQCCSIRKEYAEIIDNFFTVYGYAVRKIKLLNLHTRQSFNYVKTAGCLINGQLPAEDKRLIQDIYDKGITFWHTSLANVGDYSQSNGSVT